MPLIDATGIIPRPRARTQTVEVAIARSLLQFSPQDQSDVIMGDQLNIGYPQRFQWFSRSMFRTLANIDVGNAAQAAMTTRETDYPKVKREVYAI